MQVMHLHSLRSVSAARIALSLLLPLSLLIAARRAGAVDIPRLTGQVTDLANAVPTNHPTADAALAGLVEQRDIKLYVLFVRTNGGLSPAEFAREVWNANSLGGRAMLLVVTTDELTTQFWREGGAADVTDAELRELHDDVLPESLLAGRFEQLIIDAAARVGEAASTPAQPGRNVPSLAGSITDLIDALAGQRGEAEQAIKDLTAGESIDLFVLITNDIAQQSATIFADEVARKNSLGGNDVLLVIFFNQQGFFTEYDSAFWKGAALDEVTDEELSDIAAGEVARAVAPNHAFTLAIVSAAAAIAEAKHAEEIPVVQAPVTDKTGVLDPDRTRIEAAIKDLNDATDIDLFVLFVKTTGNRPIAEFAGKVVDKNSKLQGKYVLFTVAVDDRTDVISKDQRLNEITRDEILDFLTNEVDPLIIDRDHAGAVLTAVAAVQRTFLDLTPTPTETAIPPAATAAPGAATGTSTGTSSGGGIPILPVLLVGGVIVGALIVFSRIRRGVTMGRRMRDQRAQQEQSLEQLTTQANGLLLKADDIMRDVEQEVGFAEAELPEAEVRPLREALALAKGELETAFETKQDLDDSEPEDAATQQRMLSDIIERTQGALDLVDQERKRVASVRNLEKTAPDLIARLESQIPGVEATLAEAAKTYQRLHAYADSNWAPVDGNVDAARTTLAAARGHLAAGKQAMASDDRRTAARSALAAQSAISQAGALLDAITNTERSLLELQQGLTADLTAAARDLEAAKKVIDARTVTGFEAAYGDAEHDLRAAQALAIAPKPDLVTAARFTGKASATAGAILAAAAGAPVDVVREDQMVQASIRDAEASLQRAKDVVGSRRDTVTVAGRSRLVQAQKTLDLAKRMASGGESRSTAVVAARRAEALSRAAYDPAFANATVTVQTLRPAEKLPEGAAEALQLAGTILRAMSGGAAEASAIPTIVVQHREANGGEQER